MAPPQADRAVTYRAGRQRRKTGTSPNHPYATDQPRQTGTARGSGTSAQTCYSLLGVDQRASREQIEQAYRRQVVQSHPDRFFNDPARYAEALEKLRELNATMMVLRDPVLRAEYDAGLTDRSTMPPLARRMRATPRPHVM
jgi:DnaJ-class molecular chaperone